MKLFLLLATLGLVSGCTTINVTTTGNVAVDAHKEIAVVDPNATVGLPLL